MVPDTSKLNSSGVISEYFWNSNVVLLIVASDQKRFRKGHAPVTYFYIYI